MTAVTVKDIIYHMEQLAPPQLAESWDPIGLSFGTKAKEVKTILVALDVDQDTIQEAKNKGVDLIVTHHPAIFGSLKTLNGEDARRRDYIELVKSDIAVFSAHTNLDAAENGLNEWLADAIGLEKDTREIVSVNTHTGYKKIAVYVPHDSAEKVRIALHETGAGEVGDYKHVSYTMEGHGRFTPQEGSTPTEGEIGKEKQMDEQRIEMMVKDKDVSKALDAIYRSHPYEEPVFDLYTLEHQKDAFGFGRVGQINEAKTIKEMIDILSPLVNVEGMRFGTKDPAFKHERVAIFGGSGEKYYKDALAKGATLFITGDVSYHGAQDMLRDGLSFIDAGHYMEALSVPHLKQYLEEIKTKNNWSIDIIETTEQKDVFSYYKN
ncbi:Nif3-like dinuclear metal center hexameric protein [Alkalibacterium sp. MB6]|uniref:Nif3-like dinuclear metal center hexameric protein n=1 Tax=Alkalibacterium sp. MB6 TaxID=2081965 RepID=UPI00137B381A|nr:Nif3-like dinuclear metal center hexameric protein [Alkalibacterium sp. MB6]